MCVCVSLPRVDIFAFLHMLRLPICHFASLHVCFGACVTKPLTSNKNHACQVRLLRQSAITPLTCSSWKLMLTVMDGANETSKCERCPEKCICAFVRVRETFAKMLTTSLCLHVGVFTTLCVHVRERDGSKASWLSSRCVCRYL